LPVVEARVTVDGVAGDRQRDGRNHGGPDRAVTLLSLERIERLRAEGHPIGIGTTGENLTVSGVEWDALGPGVRLMVGEVELEVTRFAAPCPNIAGSFLGGEFGRLSQKLHPGWSRLCARVLRAGEVRAGDAVEVLSGGPPAA